MEFNGTKGNWTIEFKHINKKCAYAIKEFNGNANEDVANAKLISVAPELLEIAQITLNWIKTGGEMEADIKNKCEKAIKKALG